MAGREGGGGAEALMVRWERERWRKKKTSEAISPFSLILKPPSLSHTTSHSQSHFPTSICCFNLSLLQALTSSYEQISLAFELFWFTFHDAEAKKTLIPYSTFDVWSVWLSLTPANNLQRICGKHRFMHKRSRFPKPLITYRTEASTFQQRVSPVEQI